MMEGQILNFPRLTYRYWEYDENTINSWFRDVPKREWDEPPCITFIASLGPSVSTNFLRFVIHQLVRFESFFANGRTQFLMFLSGNEVIYMKTKSGPNLKLYRSSSVMYNTLFDIEIFDSLPFTHFSPDINLAKVKSVFIFTTIYNK